MRARICCGGEVRTVEVPRTARKNWVVSRRGVVIPDDTGSYRVSCPKVIVPGFRLFAYGHANELLNSWKMAFFLGSLSRIDPLLLIFGSGGEKDSWKTGILTWKLYNV